MKKIVILLLVLFAAFKLYQYYNGKFSKPEPPRIQTQSPETQTSMRVTSSAFENNQAIPGLYSCDGQNVNPPLSFLDVPSSAVSLVLIMEDPDVPQNIRPDRLFVHWVVFNVQTTAAGFNQDQAPPGILGNNSAGKAAYTGPCPPKGEHRYFFKLYALDIMLNLSQGATKEQVVAAMQGHILAQAELLGRFERNR